MLWFTKGKYEGEYVKDMIKSEFQGKELHKWAQSTVESDYYIKYMTMENEIVYDPFMGQGTFGVSAKKLNRQFIGSEIDPAHFETAQRLISS
jgi:DNA modification methylase